MKQKMLKICNVLLLTGIAAQFSFGFGNSIRKSEPHTNSGEILEKCRMIKERVKARKDNGSQGRQLNQAQKVESAEDVIQLELFSGEVIPFKVDHVKEKKAPQNISEKEAMIISDWGKFEYTSARGHVLGEPGSNVVLVFSGGRMSGSVERGGKNRIDIMSDKEGSYVAKELDLDLSSMHCGAKHDVEGGVK